MATCELCNMEMLKANGCGVSEMHAYGKLYKRVPVGGKGDFYQGDNEQTRCTDCNALIGEYHHWGCDCERCPVCGQQLITCDCNEVYAEGCDKA